MPSNERLQLTSPLGGRAGRGVLDAAASRSPFGEHRRPRLIAVLCSLALPGMPGCGSRDYMFGVAGQVIDVGGKPVPNARVTLTTDRPVYDTDTPLRTRTIETDIVGWFAVVYRTHHLPTPYVLLVEKQGCTSKKVSGVAPPSQEHSIRLDCQGGSQMPPDR